MNHKVKSQFSSVALKKHTKQLNWNMLEQFSSLLSLCRHL